MAPIELASWFHNKRMVKFQPLFLGSRTSAWLLSLRILSSSDTPQSFKLSSRAFLETGSCLLLEDAISEVGWRRMHSTLTISSHSLSRSLQMNDNTATWTNRHQTRKIRKPLDKVVIFRNRITRRTTKCLPKFVQTDNASFGIKTANDFLTINCHINIIVTYKRHSKLPKTAKPPEYNRPSI